MSMIGYLEIETERQGRLEGDVSIAGRDGLIEVHEWEHGMKLDGTSGVIATGGVQHGPLTFRKPTDRTTPLLYQVLSQQDVIRMAAFNWYLPSGVGGDRLVYRVELGNGRIVALKTGMQDALDTGQDRYRTADRVTLRYERILWSWGDGGDTAFEDYWDADWQGGLAHGS